MILCPEERAQNGSRRARRSRQWLLFGPDSGFESPAALWYTEVRVNLAPVM